MSVVLLEYVDVEGSPLDIRELERLPSEQLGSLMNLLALGEG